MYELGGAKQAGSTYAHGGPAGKRGKSLREGRKNTPAPLRAEGPARTPPASPRPALPPNCARPHALPTARDARKMAPNALQAALGLFSRVWWAWGAPLSGLVLPSALHHAKHGSA